MWRGNEKTWRVDESIEEISQLDWRWVCENGYWKRKYWGLDGSCLKEYNEVTYWNERAYLRYSWIR